METTNSLSNLSTNQLKRALQIREQIDALETELNQITSGGSSSSSSGQSRSTGAKQSAKASAEPKVDGRRGRRQLTPAARKRIAEAQRARWARTRGDKAESNEGAKETNNAKAGRRQRRRRMSPEGLARIREAQRLRRERERANQG